MTALDAAARRVLDSKIVVARREAEKGARAALDSLAVTEERPYASMDDTQKDLRNRLRARGRQLGEGSLKEGYGLLVGECAYEQWHQMLFARFLAENDLLMHPAGVPVTLEECAEISAEEGEADAWTTASRYASRMLPGIFRTEDPVLRVRLFPEGRRALEDLLEQLPPATFTADDGLGWVYQFWQTEAKEEVNASGRKVGGADLPAVTQLFTENYMVKFLLHNSLGAWWASRHPDSPINAELEYLRRREDGSPAAGDFSGWPESAAGLKVLDPCCGSGHFLTAAAELLARMRVEEEGLSEAAAFDAVLAENLFGLELDARCTQIAAFALALQVWKRGGYRELPVPNVACSGLAVGGREEEWTGLAGDDIYLEGTLRRLHGLFANAPELGSLIDPARVSEDLKLGTADFEKAEGLLDRALERDRRQDDPAAAVFGEAARGLVRAAGLLRGRYHLVATNVPYLARGKQDETLKDHLETYHPAGKNDLATAFVQRCADYCAPSGSYALVTPQNWLFQDYYAELRQRLLKQQTWILMAWLGSGAFATIDGEVVKPSLCIFDNGLPQASHDMVAVDASSERTVNAKSRAIHSSELYIISQSDQLRNPDGRITLDSPDETLLLKDFADYHNGICSGDYSRFGRSFWELPQICSGWRFQQSTVSGTAPYGGREHIFHWEDGRGEFYNFVCERLGESRVSSWIRGEEAWNKQGIAVSATGALPVSLYTGELFDDNTVVIIPKDTFRLRAIWAFCSSGEYYTTVRRIDQALKVRGPLVRVPFDLERWQKVADEQYPDGLPEPYSDDPTQWLFHGHPAPATNPLQVAVARLVGYRWPAEMDDEEMELSQEARRCARSSAALDPHTDGDGVVCLTAVENERPADERLRSLLADAFGEEWTTALRERLLSDVGSPGKDLHTWLRDDFFAQHCKLFHNRPFVWHVWDGRKDGFSALVNYHRLDHRLLEKLTYTYLGDYIEACTAEANADVKGADQRLGAARDLQEKLAAILHGEPPYDIYVRWKPRAEQPTGWEPDLNDGVRLNIRPFMNADILRKRPNINWKKDRGKNPDGTDRHNDVHLSRAEKEEARKRCE